MHDIIETEIKSGAVVVTLHDGQRWVIKQFREGETAEDALQFLEEAGYTFAEAMRRYTLEPL